MKRLILVAALAALTVAPAARAETTGSILLGNPASSQAGGVTENAGGCDVASPLQGLDGVWYEVGAGEAVVATLTGGATGLEDLDVWFYDAECGFIDFGEMATENVSETGTSPAGAAFMIVDLFTGAQATFTVS